MTNGAWVPDSFVQRVSVVSDNGYTVFTRPGSAILVRQDVIETANTVGNDGIGGITTDTTVSRQTMNNENPRVFAVYKVIPVPISVQQVE